MKRIYILIGALLFTIPCDVGADSYPSFRDLQQNQAMQDSLELQREQIRLQREQLELLRGMNEKDKAAKNAKLDAQIKIVIDRSVNEQYATFLKLYPIYSTDKIRAAALTSAVVKTQESPQFASRRLDLSAFTDILLEAHKIVVHDFGDF